MKQDPLKAKFKPLQDKTLQNALAHQIAKEFPRIGGPRMCGLCAQMILEVFEKHLRPREQLRHAQVLWMSYGIDDPPSRYKRTAETELVPVVLDLSVAEDLEARMDRVSARRRLRDKAIRLCRQAYEQGGLLSNCDLAELLSVDAPYLGSIVSEYERERGHVVPRRATVHDMGSGLTHKRIICRKRYVQGKEAEQIARETYHSLEAVDRYLGQYERVRQCRREGMDAQRIAYTLRCSVALVGEYLRIDDELEPPDA